MLCSCSGFKGFWIKSFAPASMAERSCDCVPTEETIMISASLSKSIISRIAALPSFTGITISRKDKSGFSFLQISIASCPLDASKKVGVPYFEIKSFNCFRASMESSLIRIFALSSHIVNPHFLICLQNLFYTKKNGHAIVIYKIRVVFSRKNAKYGLILFLNLKDGEIIMSASL